MSVQNPERVVTKQDLADFYQEILPYLGGEGGGGGSTELPMVSTLPTPSVDYNGKRVLYVGANDTTNDLYQGVIYECALDPFGVYIWRVAATNLASGYFEWKDPVYYDITMGSTGTDNPRQRACIKVKTDSTPTSGSSNLLTSGGAYTALANKQDKIAYSTSEQVIGTWVGGATLYQRTFTGTTSSSATETQVSTWTNSYIIREFKGTYTQSTGVYVPICYMVSTSDWMVPYTENGKLWVGYSASNKGKAYYLTVIYTK